MMTLAGAAQAEAPAQIELLPGWRQDQNTHMAALRIRLAPGWKTYWRSPGDAGIPPQFDLEQSTNLAGAAVHFPAPEVFDTSGVRVIGYHDTVLLPIELALSDPDQPARLSGTVYLGVCEEICVPMQVAFDMPLPASSRAHPAITAALQAQPRAHGAVACDIAPGDRGMHVSMRPDQPLASDETAAIELPGVSVSPAQIEGGAAHGLARTQTIARADLRLTVISASGAREYRGCK